MEVKRTTGWCCWRSPARPLPRTSSRTRPRATGASLDPENTLYLELPAGRVVIELAERYAPGNVDAIRKLAREKYFDGSFVIRSQDNYVVQWGRPEDDERAKEMAKAKLTPEFARAIAAELPFTRLAIATSTRRSRFLRRLPGRARPEVGPKTWLAHCYGSCGAGRDDAADTGNGSELYVVIGHSPRRLDRNITLVGRVVRGIERVLRDAARHRRHGLLREALAVGPDSHRACGRRHVGGASARISRRCARRAGPSSLMWNRAPIGAKRGSRSPSGAWACAISPCRCARSLPSPGRRAPG